MRGIATKRMNGFSLVELVIVVVIIGIIGAIAIPRMSRASRNAGASALKADLQTLRNAVELYAAEHDGKLPGATLANQLTLYSSADGSSTSATKDVANKIVYGPYLKEVPKMPVGVNKSSQAVKIGSGTFTFSAGDTEGWWYATDSGKVVANLPSSDVDDDGMPYNGY